jgi:hypothetical protein
MGEQMTPTRSSVVQTDHLVAERALGIDLMKPTSPNELQKFD